MKAKRLSFAFIYFSESGLFKGLPTIQTEKSFPMSHCVSNVTTAAALLSLTGQATQPGPGFDSATEKYIA
jgi:hypothetical protein